MAATATVVALSAITVGNTISQRNAILARGSVEESISRSNARIARIQSAGAIRRGERKVSDYRLRQKQLTGTQRARLSAQGIDPNSGTGAAIVVEDIAFGDLDILEIRNNARLESFGFKSQALTSEGRARFAKLSAKSEARQTVLTGATQFARDLLLFGSSTAGRKTTKTGAPVFRPRNPTEARFNKGFARARDTAAVGFAR